MNLKQRRARERVRKTRIHLFFFDDQVQSGIHIPQLSADKRQAFRQSLYSKGRSDSGHQLDRDLYNDDHLRRRASFLYKEYKVPLCREPIKKEQSFQTCIRAPSFLMKEQENGEALSEVQEEMDLLEHLLLSRGEPSIAVDSSSEDAFFKNQESIAIKSDISDAGSVDSGIQTVSS